MVKNHLDSLQWAAAIITEADGVIQTCNAAFRALTDLPDGEEPSGRRLADVFGIGCHAVENAFSAAAYQKRPIRVARAACYTTLGAVRYFNIQARPVQWRKEAAILISIWDLSAVEGLLQQALVEGPRRNINASERIRSRVLLQTLMNHVPVGIAVMNLLNNRIMWISRYGGELLGVSGEELMQIPLEDLPEQLYLYHLDGETRAVGDEMPMLRATREVIQDEEWILRQPGRSAIHIIINAGPIKDAGGVVIGSVIVWHDISRQHEAERQVREYAEQLERSNRDLQDFASVVSHDLQEPLRKVRLFGNMLKERYGGQIDAEGLDYIERMQRASERMQQMIDNLLAYSRVTTHTREFAPVVLRDVVAGVLIDLEGRMQESGGTVEVGDLPVIQGDAMQMQQLFQNLISNALKYHKPGIPPVVHISAQPVGGREVEIYVQDNGIGFDINYLEHVFKPFSRLHGRSAYEGTGIGLAICRRIVERHHGSITATSTPGEGSTFIVRLPRR